MALHHIEAVLVDRDGTPVAVGLRHTVVIPLDELVQSIELSEDVYVIDLDGVTVPVRVAAPAPGTGDRRILVDDTRNLLESLPHEDVLTWDLVDEIVPLRPRPLDGRRWPASQRRAMMTMLLVLGITSLLLLRPIGWATVGGQERIAEVMTISRVYLLWAPLAMALCAFVVTRALLMSTSRARYLGLIGVIALGLDVGARMGIEVSSLVGTRAPRSLPPDVLDAWVAMRWPGWLGELSALTGAFFAFRASRRAWYRRAAPWCVAAAFVLPVLSYAIALGLNAHVASQLVALDGWTPRMATAGGLQEPYEALIFMAVVIAAWQAVTFVQAIGEATPRVSAHVVRLRAGARSRAVSVGVAILAVAAAKAVFDIAGYRNALPHWLGGAASLWERPAPWSVWPLAACVFLPIGYWLVRRIPPSTQARELVVPVLVLAALQALPGPVQVVSQTLADVLPGAGIRPRSGEALFVSLELLDAVSYFSIAAGAVFLLRRSPAAGALFGLCWLLRSPGEIGALTGWHVPVVGLGQIDLLLSLIVAIWALGDVLGATRRPVPPGLIAAWLGLSVLVHFSTLIPDATQTSLFTIGAVLPVAYTVFWDGDALNETARRDGAGGLIALGLSAGLMVLVAAQVWLGDRFGRDLDTFISNASVMQAAQRMMIGLPLLLVLTRVAFPADPSSRVDVSV